MSASKPQPAVKRSDPSLRERPSKDAFRPFGLPRWAGFLLYAFFWVVLIIPFVRRCRRKPSWNRVRIAAGVVAALLLGMAWALPNLWLAAPAATIALAAVLLGPAPDPEKERKLQARYQADYLLNGGYFASGPLPGEPELAAGTVVYLLVRGREKMPTEPSTAAANSDYSKQRRDRKGVRPNDHGRRPPPHAHSSPPKGMKTGEFSTEHELLVVPVDGPGEAISVLPLESISEVHVDGQPYRPVYVPEAKDPPVRENSVDRSKTATLQLVTAEGATIRFEYQGAFCKPLAEAAAHAIHSVLLANRVPRHPPEVFHIVGR